MTDFLAFMGNLSERPYLSFATRLRSVLELVGEDRIVDLCSGSGGPLPTIQRILRRREGYPVRAVLTDLYPDAGRMQWLARQHDDIEVELEPVDATAVPGRIEGLRFLANGFHHFRPEEARTLLADAVARRRPIAIIEGMERASGALVSALLSPLNVLLLTPFIRPLSWRSLLWTYVVPLVPLFTLWDAVVSCLRVYSPDELRALVAGLPSNDYVWDIGRLPIPATPMGVTYLIGHPPRPEARPSPPAADLEASP